MSLFKIGLIVNPMAGIGGRVGLKGSDGEAIRQQALDRGAEPLANQRAQQTLACLTSCAERAVILTVGGDMGESAVQQAGLSCEVIAQSAVGQTEASDTQHAVKSMLEHQVDLLLFAGGDGTARDVYSALEHADAVDKLSVVGIPAGCKIHSAVYAISPRHAGELVASLIEGKPARLIEADVMDIDEQAFRQGIVKARRYGGLWVPQDHMHMQSLKEGGVAHEELQLHDIAQCVVDNMEPDVLYFIGSGTTPAAIMQELGLDNTLLGIDLVLNQQLIASDLTEQDILRILQSEQKPARLVITVIGGQGVVFGRGNQQLSPQVIRTIGKENIIYIATTEKLRRLQSEPLHVDSGDETLNNELAGTVKILTGYNDYLLYRISN